MSKNPIREEFEDEVKACGNSAHIRLSKKWLHKTVRVIVEEIKK
jgi:putative transposon-encoded protein